MLSAMPKGLYVPSLLLDSMISRFATHASSVKCSPFGKSKRTFLTTASVAKEKTAKKNVQKAEENKDLGIPEYKAALGESKAPNGNQSILENPPKSPWQDFYHQYVIEHRKKGQVYTSYTSDALAIWRAMSAEERAKYGASTKELAKYTRLSKGYPSMAAILKKDGKYLPKLSPSEIAARAENLFIRENYDKNSPLPFLERGAELSKRWIKLSWEEKEIYEQRAIEIYEKG